ESSSVRIFCRMGAIRIAPPSVSESGSSLSVSGGSSEPGSSRSSGGMESAPAAESALFSSEGAGLPCAPDSHATSNAVIELSNISSPIMPIEDEIPLETNGHRRRRGERDMTDQPKGTADLPLCADRPLVPRDEGGTPRGGFP